MNKPNMKEMVEICFDWAHWLDYMSPDEFDRDDILQAIETMPNRKRSAELLKMVDDMTVREFTKWIEDIQKAIDCDMVELDL